MPEPSLAGSLSTLRAMPSRFGHEQERLICIHLGLKGPPRFLLWGDSANDHFWIHLLSADYCRPLETGMMVSSDYQLRRPSDEATCPWTAMAKREAFGDRAPVARACVRYSLGPDSHHSPSSSPSSHRESQWFARLCQRSRGQASSAVHT